MATKSPLNGAARRLSRKKAISRPDLEAACRRVIESGHTTLWGGYFTVKGGQSEVPQAVAWLASQCESVLADLGLTIQPEVK